MKKQGLEVKIVVSSRVEPSSKKLIERDYGSWQKFVDFYLQPAIEFIKRRDKFKTVAKKDKS